MTAPLPHGRPIIEDHTLVPRPVRIGGLLLGVGALLFGLAVLLYVLWLMLASVTATPFDADGVRCYHRAGEIACLKTAEPPR